MCALAMPVIKHHESSIYNEGLGIQELLSRIQIKHNLMYLTASPTERNFLVQTGAT